MMMMTCNSQAKERDRSRTWQWQQRKEKCIIKVGKGFLLQLLLPVLRRNELLSSESYVYAKVHCSIKPCKCKNYTYILFERGKENKRFFFLRLFFKYQTKKTIIISFVILSYIWPIFYLFNMRKHFFFHFTQNRSYQVGGRNENHMNQHAHTQYDYRWSRRIVARTHTHTALNSTHKSN
jgi:hypothetical protein